jgi:hypothetical protein
MSLIVARTCTEIKVGDDGQVRLGESRPLSGFRSRPALVLLGDPGAGKTTEFKEERAALSVAGAEACYLTARNFAWDIDSDPDLRNKVLLIDGLDEIRAGSGDGRAPLDRIRRRLARLGRPEFRISCREADWLGVNDRDNLAAVSPDEQLTVVRLDPLTEGSVMELLGSRIPASAVKGLIDKARRRGIRPLLDNPLTLKLLVGAVQEDDLWPESRRETFEMACKKLASEQNSEHRNAVAQELPIAVMDAAGHFCALQLLSGIEGYSLPPGPYSSSFVGLDRLEHLPEHVSLTALKRALATRLFTAEGETAFVPIHRQLAEFLGGRYLAGRVENGLPAGRITALMTSPADGRVVTELRGLSAWLAAHSREARRLLIDADPVGVGLYGDIGGFTVNDKERLLASLAAFARQGPLLGHGWRDGRNAGYRDNTAWAFRSLVTEDMVPAITSLIDPGDGEAPDDRLMEFVLSLLSQAPEGELEQLAGLVPYLKAILRDAERSNLVKLPALDAYIRVTPCGDAKTRELRILLESVQGGSLPDPDDQLRGTLLGHLYPDDVSPADVWRYVIPRNQMFVGRFRGFWNRTILAKSSRRHLEDLLETLSEADSEFLLLLDQAHLRDTPVRLLGRYLETIGGKYDIDWLYNQLSTISQHSRVWRDGASPSVRRWLEDHPHVQKELFLRWIRQTPDHPVTPYSDRFGYVLLDSELPDDFGLWCLDQAISLYATDPVLSKRLLKEAHNSLSSPSISEGLSIETMRERLRLHETLIKELEDPRRPPSTPVPSAPSGYKAEIRQLRQQQQDEERRQREDWERHLRTHESELRENRFSSENLGKLAAVYFGWARPDAGASGRDQIADFIGGDPHLVELVMDALRDAIRSDDVPEVDTTLSLFSASRRPWLTFPILASMDLLADDMQGMNGLDEERRRRALAIYYCFAAGDDAARVCQGAWFQEDPDLVLDVLYRCALAGLRKGGEVLPGVNDLDLLEDHRELVHDTRLRLLEAFPTRILNNQLEPFDHLLGKTLEYGDTGGLKALADKKLALKSLGVSHRVRWLAVAALLSRGRRTEQMKTYLNRNERRVRHLAEFLRNARDNSDGLWRVLSSHRDPAIHVSLVELLGRSFGPCDLGGWVTVEISTSELIDQLISRLSSLADAEARQGLAMLVDDPGLARWRGRLIRAQELQRVVYSDASYRHPDIEQVQDTLASRAPANPADLAALLRDQLEIILDELQGGSANLWRQFWNEDSSRRPVSAKHEESCRDALLEALKRRLPSGVDAAPEGRYAGDRRADIRVAYGGFNIPIEIKKNSHPDLWSALRNQLMDRYITDPATSGYGIYLVLWFGPDETTRSPDGARPATPDDLRRVLASELTADEARKVSVIVMDVTKPGARSPRLS